MNVYVVTTKFCDKEHVFTEIYGIYKRRRTKKEMSEIGFKISKKYNSTISYCVQNLRKIKE